MNADLVLIGQINMRGDELRVRAELIDVATNNQQWSHHYDQSLDDTLAVEKEITQRIAQALRLQSTGEEQIRLAKRRPENTEAHLAYLEGRFWYHKQTDEGNQRAIAFFNKAVEADPKFALAYAGIADVYLGAASWGNISPTEAHPIVEDALQRALELHPSLAEALTAEGDVERMFTWDWTSAERAYQRAIEADPDYAFAHHEYAHLLALLGRDEEALAKFAYAAQLEPLTPHHYQCLGNHYVLMERYDDAERVLMQALEWEPNFVPAHYNLAWLHERVGQIGKAIEDMERAVELSNRATANLVLLAYYVAIDGDAERARRLLDELLERRGKSYVASAEIAKVYAGLGEMDEAMNWLDQAYESHDSAWLPYSQTDPGFDRLRGHPRFTVLYERLGLEPRPALAGTAE